MPDSSQTGGPFDLVLDTLGELGPRTCAVIGGSLLVLGAFAMGFESMATLWLGFPLGLWVILAGWAAAWVLSSQELPALGLIGERLKDVPSRTVRREETASSVRRTHHRPEMWIATDLEPEEVAAIMPHPDGLVGRVPSVKWASLSKVGAGKADAIVRRDSNGTPVIELASTRTEPAWMDWSRPLPLSYAGVFPTRIDTRRVTLHGADLSDPEEASLVGRLAEAAVRASGLAGMQARRDRFTSPAFESMDMVIRGITDHLMQRRGELYETTVSRAAARVVSAWLTVREGVLPETVVRDALEVCVELLSDEPAAHLRLAAGQFATYADDRGIETLLHAHALVCSNPAVGEIDPLGFVFSEIQHGQESPLTLGRVACGICLVWAATNEQHLPHIRDDLLDDLRYAGWLIGRDPDHCLLKIVTRELDRMRASHDTLWALAEPAMPMLRRTRAA